MTKDIRDDEQQKAVQLYLTKAPLKCTLVLSTGFGKSKVAIDILKHYNPQKILILVNSTILRDFSWKTEFEKFNALDLYNKTELVTYQAAYKWDPSEKDLSNYFIIADEVDFAGDTVELSKFFYSYPFNRTLGLTGFITNNKKDWFKEYLPVLKELKASDAQDKGILNKLHFVFVKYDLSDNPDDVLIEFKKQGVNKSFTQSENNYYDYINKQIQILMIQQSVLSSEFLDGSITDQEYKSKMKRLDYKITDTTKKRATLLLTSKSSQRITKNLIAHILEKNPVSKIIVFSKRTAQSLAICGEDNIYSGAIPKKKALINFENFNSGTSRVLGVCDKVNRGVNIDGLDIAILESFYGSDTQATQRLGRMMRLNPDNTATVYIMLPYYMRKEKPQKNEALKTSPLYTVQETQQVVWANKMLRSTDIKSQTVWDYRIVQD